MLLFVVVLAGCDQPTSPTLSMDGDWGISGTADGCGFFARAQITGTLEDFMGAAHLEGVGAPADVGLVGTPKSVVLGPLNLSIENTNFDFPRGTFKCDGTSGLWSMYRYSN